MKAVVFHGIGDIRLDNVPEPQVDLVETGAVDPEEILTQREPLTSAIEAYKAFDKRQPGWSKVELVPGK